MQRSHRLASEYFQQNPASPHYPVQEIATLNRQVIINNKDRGLTGVTRKSIMNFWQRTPRDLSQRPPPLAPPPPPTEQPSSIPGTGPAENAAGSPGLHSTPTPGTPTWTTEGWFSLQEAYSPFSLCKRLRKSTSSSAIA